MKPGAIARDALLGALAVAAFLCVATGGVALLDFLSAL